MIDGSTQLDPGASPGDRQASKEGRSATYGDARKPRGLERRAFLESLR